MGEEMYTDIYKLINDVFLVNYWDKKRGNAELIGSDKINEWIKILRGFDYKHQIAHTQYSKGHDMDPIPSNEELLEIITEKFPLIVELLTLAGGKMSLCGGAILALITGHSYFINDFDFFFHTEGSIEEIDNILIQCREILIPHTKNFRRSLGVETFISDRMKIQFIKRIYKSRDQVLLGFDLAGCRFGWNPFDGFFSTYCGGIAYALQAFPVDLTQRSFSHGHRLEKYSFKFNILLPGFPKKQEYLTTPDGEFIIHNRYHCKCKSSLHFDFRANYTNDCSDYDPSCNNNFYALVSDKLHNITFESENFEDINNLTDECVRQSFEKSWFLRHKKENFKINHGDLPLVKEFMGSLWREFSLAYYTESDYKGASKIWKQAIDNGVETCKRVATSTKEYPWKYKNPGSQSFGKHNPIIADPREWYGPDYRPIIVGISNERYHSLLDSIDVPHEIIRIICNYWLWAEANDARTRLNNIVIITNIIKGNVSIEERMIDGVVYKIVK